MDFKKFKAIYNFRKENSEQIETYIEQFLKKVNSTSSRNIRQTIREYLNNEGFIVVELPMRDKEIGALCYNTKSTKYILLNSSLPLCNENFAFIHEAFHVAFPTNQNAEVEVYMDSSYSEKENELYANAFASTLLMPKEEFISKFDQYSSVRTKFSELQVMCKISSYFRTPFTAAVIRSYELGLITDPEIIRNLLEMNIEKIRECYKDLWIDDTILYSSNRDDFYNILTHVKQKGENLVDRQLLYQSDLDGSLEKLQVLYSKLKGDQ